MNTDEDCFFPQDGRLFGYWFVNDESRKREVWNYELRIMNYELGIVNYEIQGARYKI